MNNVIMFLENIYMMDGYDLWLKNNNINLENVKEDINSKMKMDIISETKNYNKRYASFIGSLFNTPLNEAYFSSNMISETKSYIKKFISGLNNIINISENKNIKDYSYNFMLNSYRYLNEIDENVPNESGKDPVKTFFTSVGASLDNIEKNAEALKKNPGVSPDDKSKLTSLLSRTKQYGNSVDILEKQKEIEDVKKYQEQAKTQVQTQGQEIEESNINTYEYYKNFKKILESEADTSSTQNLIELINKKIQDHINAGTDMNKLWTKVQDDVSLTKGLTFNQSMEKFKNNNGILNNILTSLKI